MSKTVPEDTIAAISTASGEGGIAIVRVSGPDSLIVGDRVFRCRGTNVSGRAAGAFVHGHVVDEGGNVIEEAILLVYRGPHSYTREDAIELQCHGGAVPVRRVLRTVLAAGARIAEPGEFTKRAFLNGRIDLTQAEAVADLIAARTERSAASALAQLDGVMERFAADQYEALVMAAADLEALLDFPEDDLPDGVVEAVSSRLSGICKGLSSWLDTAEEGHVLRDGVLTVIAGPPNAGKSTLLNRLVGFERAIVSAQPGTTRDTIEETVNLDGIAFRLVDTAGLRESECTIEQEGVSRARATVEGADLILYVMDASDPGSGNGLKPGAGTANRTIVVLNKTDLRPASGVQERPAGVGVVACSCLTGAGLPELRAAMVAACGVNSASPPHATLSERHRHCIQDVLNALNAACALLTHGEDEIALAAIEIREAMERINDLTGRECGEDVLGAVFQRFCIGK